MILSREFIVGSSLHFSDCGTPPFPEKEKILPVIILLALTQTRSSKAVILQLVVTLIVIVPL